MIVIRLMSCLLLLIGGYWITKINVFPIYSNEKYIVVSGIINIWSGIACFMWGGYGLIYYFNDLIKLPFNVGNFNKPILLIGLVISPLLTFIIHGNITNIKKDYIECNELREFSSRYSSRTYAISPEVCSLLKNNNP